MLSGTSEINQFSRALASTFQVTRCRYSTIAYSGQQPWLLNGTIRENILFGESYRPKRYENIIEMCALRADIDLMPDGDQTQVGERGLNLSGGQKMRVSIARAVYSSANVIILVCHIFLVTRGTNYALLMIGRRFLIT